MAYLFRYHEISLPANARYLDALAAVDDPTQGAKVGRCFMRLHAHGLIAKIPRTRHWRVTSYGRQTMGASHYLREQHFPNAYTAATAA